VSAGGPYSGNEGSAISLNGSASDQDSFTTTWSYTAGPDVDAGATCTFANPSSPATTITCTDDGHFTVTLTAKDTANAATSDSTTVTVANVPPSATITSPPNGTIYQVGLPVAVSANVSDPGKNDKLTCSIDFGDGTVIPGTLSAGKCQGSHAYTKSGTYNIKVTATDDDGGSGTSPPVSVKIL